MLYKFSVTETSSVLTLDDLMHLFYAFLQVIIYDQIIIVKPLPINHEADDDDDDDYLLKTPTFAIPLS